ncbi:MAG: helix-turn-helix domain-containing protein [Oscillospiraceae bacterium]|nr:helix-turn-helix domain-containing protein [Oscillospiraceae bacterium]
MTLNEMIRKYRRERELTQEQLAEAMGVSAASVSKWETGQAAPELTVLMELADFFEVSVDTLMGHTVNGERKNTLIQEMKAFDKADKNGEARALAEKLLRAYPNDAEVVEEAAHVYYDSHVRENKPEYIEQAIALTKRLFTLTEDKTGMKRFELLSTLGNQYENLQDWETARKYYKEGNVGNLNDRALARLLANEEKDGEAVEAISKIFFKNLYLLLTDVLVLEQCWKKLEEPEKAAAANRWALALIEGGGPTIREQMAPLAKVFRWEQKGTDSGDGEFLTGITSTIITGEYEDKKGGYIHVGV